MEVAPQYAGLTMGLSNTIATLPGMISPVITGFIVQNKVTIPTATIVIDSTWFPSSSWLLNGRLCSTSLLLYRWPVEFSTRFSVRENSSRGQPKIWVSLHCFLLTTWSRLTDCLVISNSCFVRQPRGGYCRMIADSDNAVGVYCR